jgi:hypothetical protein
MGGHILQSSLLTYEGAKMSKLVSDSVHLNECNKR